LTVPEDAGLVGNQARQMLRSEPDFAAWPWRTRDVHHARASSRSGPEGARKGNGADQVKGKFNSWGFPAVAEWRLEMQSALRAPRRRSGAVRAMSGISMQSDRRVPLIRPPLAAGIGRDDPTTEVFKETEMTLRMLPAVGLVLVTALACATAGAQQPQGAQAQPEAQPEAQPQAQAPQAAPAQQPMNAKEAKAKFAERFKAADTNHDGKLTREEAKAGMPEVYKHFNEMDTKKKGYVTQRQIGAFWALKTKENAVKKDPSSLN